MQYITLVHYSLLLHKVISCCLADSKKLCLCCNLQLPVLTDMATVRYLSGRGSAATKSKLYDAGFVMFVRAAWSDDSQFIFLRGQCSAEMKKTVMDLIDIKLDETGDIVETQFECAAGVGPSAHCKHVCAILFAVNDLTMHEHIKLRLTCTQKIQSFQQTKQFLAQLANLMNCPM